MIKSDYHMHTNFSVDSEAKIEDMIEKSIEIGLEEIIITDHYDYTVDGVSRFEEASFDEYVKNFNKLKEKYVNKINILLGAELGVGAHCKKNTKDFVSKFSFEFIIGSCHTISGYDIYDYRDEIFNDVDKQNIFEKYLNELLFNIKNFDFINVLGHIDYIIRYPNFKDNTMYFNEFEDIISEIYKEVIHRGKGIEINSSGYRYGLNCPHPSIELIAKYKEMGGEIITIGSDAHSPKYIGQNFDDIEKLLKEIGFKAYTRFKNGKPYWVDL